MVKFFFAYSFPAFDVYWMERPYWNAAPCGSPPFEGRAGGYCGEEQQGKEWNASTVPTILFTGSAGVSARIIGGN